MLNNNNEIIAGIITYNPELDRLEKNLAAIIEQVSTVILVDNDSDNVDKIVDLTQKYHAKLIINNANLGIACALNQIMEYAEKNDSKWCITLDQDSVVPPNIVKEARGVLSYGNVGAVVPMIYENETGELCLLGERNAGTSYQDVERAITSACITNVDAWRAVGRFDEGLYIDYVDYDFVMQLRKNGYRVIRMNKCFLNHQLGESSIGKLFGFRIRVGNHSAMRKYYIARNIIIYIRRYWRDIDLLKEVMRLNKVFLLIVLFENEKKNKLKNFFKGVKDGISYNTNERN